MFCILPTGKILMAKGDNAEIDLRLYNKEGREVKILPSDVITFTVKQSADKSPIIEKEAYINSIILEPEDTWEMDAGVYYYQIDLYRDNEVQTVVPANLFEVRETLR